MALLAPSILSADLSNLAQQVRLVEMAGADFIHCDIMDGHFVPNISFGPAVVKSVNKITNLPLDVHLMIKNPDKYIEEFVEAGANSLTIHQEEVIHLNRTIHEIKKLGIKAGVAINPSTPVSMLSEIADIIDLVLVMSVNPGFGGQAFITNSLQKIAETVALRKKYNANFLIEVDGGLDNKTVKPVLHAGCDVFVAGSSIFKADNISAAAMELKNLINEK